MTATIKQPTDRVVWRRLTVECGPERRPFPLDMLRYDQSAPFSETDSIDITNSVRGGHVGSVKLRQWRYADTAQDRDRPPAHQRWESFGWRVTAIDRL